MNSVALLERYFDSNRDSFEIILEHSALVAQNAVRIAKSLDNHDLDLKFVEDAAMLHDVGVSRTHAPRIGCFGDAPYICHGILGREILEKEGLPDHALVCERHIGVGLTIQDIVSQQLDMPLRDMIPVTLPEKIICYADLFYSKRPGTASRRKTIDQIRNNVARHGLHKVAIFEKWLTEFGE
jgi:uncharacterized protein